MNGFVLALPVQLEMKKGEREKVEARGRKTLQISPRKVERGGKLVPFAALARSRAQCTYVRWYKEQHQEQSGLHLRGGERRGDSAKAGSENN